MFRLARRCIFNADLPLRNARVAVVGLGLMGGSLAMALTQWSLCQEVVGVARREETLREARGCEVAHRVTTDLVDGITGADVIVLATPVRTIIRQLHHLTAMPLGSCLLMDLGSTKTEIVAAMEELPAHVQPVGAHPMCGKETSGLAAAEPTLYEGAPWVLTPLPRTSPAALALARELAVAVGARPLVMHPDRHDRLVAAISHLPYSLAVALMLAVAEIGYEDELVWELAASGFRDSSRLAASDVTMMLDILITNPVAVGELLRRASVHLERLADLLATGDEDELHTLLVAAHDRRTPMFRHAERG
ncbi:MAG: prephenate dehydrogenase [Anaerolineales bacterium]|nr:MAG: prephenate dehydrogenase [Anaerolineales bacterium]